VHGEKEKYQVYVLWLKGHSIKTISHWTKLREKQIAGIVDRAPFKARSEMTWDERQAALNDMQRIRLSSDGSSLDGGMFDRIQWLILPLLTGQVRRG
jgi:hypothetical protein